MNFTTIFCEDVSSVRNFLQAVSFSSVKATVLPELRCDNALLSLALYANSSAVVLLINHNASSWTVFDSLPRTRQLLLPVDNFEGSKAAAIVYGGEVTDYFEDDLGARKLCVINGPEDIELVLIHGKKEDKMEQMKSIFGTYLCWRASKSDLSSKNTVSKSLDHGFLLHGEVDTITFHEKAHHDNKSNIGDDNENYNSLRNKESIMQTPKKRINNEPKGLLADSVTSSSDSLIGWDPPKGVFIPSLSITLLQEGLFRKISANTRTAIPFQTNLFEGCALLLINTKPIIDQYLPRFKGQKYQFEMQVQGKFRRQPKGPLFMGAEISKKMELGLFTKGLCETLLHFARTVNPYIHHSFGDRNNVELPHIMGPMWSAIDRLHVTPPGGTPPPMGLVFPEDQDARLARRKNPDYTVKIDLQNTYSMSYKTSNVDLVEWNVVNVPVMNSMDLHTFWGDADIRLCAYSVPEYEESGPNAAAGGPTTSVRKGPNGLPKLHPQATNEYVFAIDVKHSSNYQDLHREADAYEETQLELLRGSRRLQDVNGPLVDSAIRYDSKQADNIFTGDSTSTQRSVSPVRLRSVSSKQEIGGGWYSPSTELSIQPSQQPTGATTATNNGYSFAPIEGYFSPDAGIARSADSAEAVSSEKLTVRNRQSNLWHQRPIVNSSFDSLESGADGYDGSADKSSSRDRLWGIGEDEGGKAGDAMNFELSDEDTDSEGFCDAIEGPDSCNTGKQEDYFQPVIRRPSLRDDRVVIDNTAKNPNDSLEGCHVSSCPLLFPPGRPPPDNAFETSICSQTVPFSKDIICAPALCDRVVAAIEVDERRRGRQKARRTLYVYAPPAPFLAAMTETVDLGERSVSLKYTVDRLGNGSPLYACHFLRSHKDWLNSMPVHQMNVKPASHKRASDIEKRRILLNHSFNATLEAAKNDSSLRIRLAQFLAVGESLEDMFLPTNGGDSGVASRRLRTGLAPFMKESHVCVQLGNKFWSEEYMGVTSTELVFIKRANFMGKSSRLNLPIGSIIGVRAAHHADISVVIPDCHPMIISTFSRQYMLLLRSYALREEWVSMLSSLIRPIIPASPSPVLSRSSSSAGVPDDPSTILAAPTDQAANTVFTCSSNQGAAAPTTPRRKYTLTSLSNSLRSRVSQRSSGGVRERGESEAPTISTPLRHLDLLVRPKGWKLGDRVVLNARSFVCGSALLTSPAECPAARVFYDAFDNIRACRTFSPSKSASPRNHNTTTLDSNAEADANQIENSDKIANDRLSTSPSGPVQLLELLLTKCFALCEAINSDASSPAAATSTLSVPVDIAGNSVNGTIESTGGSSGVAASVGVGVNGCFVPTIDDDMSEKVQSLWIDFMDGVALLQAVDLTNLDLASDEAMCLFLNLYHLLLMHAFLVVGPPSGAYKWSNFFGTLSYEAFGDVFTIAELEHCILRNGMARPNVGLITQYFIPRSVYSFALQQGDFRLLWALNCGSLTLLPAVPVYKPSLLEAQLNYVMIESVPVQVMVGDSCVTLPAFCQWYMRDLELAASAFASAKSAESAVALTAPATATPAMVLELLLSYCRGEHAEAILKLLSRSTCSTSSSAAGNNNNNMAPITLKFAAFDFRCRFFQRLNEENFLVPATADASDLSAAAPSASDLAYSPSLMADR